MTKVNITCGKGCKMNASCIPKGQWFWGTMPYDHFDGKLHLFVKTHNQIICLENDTTTWNDGVDIENVKFIVGVNIDLFT